MITIKRDGWWRVELTVPIRQASGPDIDMIEIRPMDFDTIIRWQQGDFPSKLSLLAAITNVREGYLRQLQGIDVERVMLAFLNAVPPAVQQGLQNPDMPLAITTDPFAQPAAVARNEDTFADDPIDPRFPKADGPVNRFPEPAAPPERPLSPELEVGAREDIMKVVGA